MKPSFNLVSAYESAEQNPKLCLTNQLWPYTMEMRSKGASSSPASRLKMIQKNVDEDEIKVLCLKWFNNSLFGVGLIILIATTSGQSIQVTIRARCSNDEQKSIKSLSHAPTGLRAKHNKRLFATSLGLLGALELA